MGHTHEIVFHSNGTKTITFNSGILKGQSRVYREGEKRPYRGENSHGAFKILFHNSEGMQSHTYTSGKLKGYTLTFKNSYERRPFRIFKKNGDHYNINYNEDDMTTLIKVQAVGN